MMRYLLVLLVVLLLAATACSNEPEVPLVASGLEITTPMPGRKMSAGFTTLRNNTENDLTITRVHSTQYERVEMHESRIEDGVAKMRRIPELVIPAKDSVVLERGGLHLMLMGAIENPEQVSLSFFDGDTLLLNVSTNIATGTK